MVKSRASSNHGDKTGKTVASKGPSEEPRNKRTFYAVRRGRDPLIQNCIFLSWDQCRHQVEGSDVAVQYDAFDSVQEAVAFLEEMPTESQAALNDNATKTSAEPEDEKDKEYLANAVAFLNTAKDKTSKKSTASIPVEDAKHDEQDPPASAAKDQDSKPAFSPNKGPPKRNATSISLWDTMFARLQIYKQKHGTCHVEIPEALLSEESKSGPKRKKHNNEEENDANIIKEPENKELHGLQYLKKWTQRQERMVVGYQQYKVDPSSSNKKDYSKRTVEHCLKLIQLGVNPEQEWNENYKILCDYKTEHENFIIPQENLEADTTGKLAKLQDFMDQMTSQVRVVYGTKEFKRTAQTHVIVSDPQMKKLAEIGFVAKVMQEGAFVLPDKRWNEMYQKLVDFQQAHGHMRVSYSDDRQLYCWVRQQKLEYEKFTNDQPSRMSPKKMKQLHDLGMEFTMREKLPWEQRFEELTKYLAEHGHTRVPRTSSLGSWVKRQRYVMNKIVDGKGADYTLTQERIDKLNGIGFEWMLSARPINPVISPQLSWDERFQQLLAFQEKNGHTMVHKNVPGLGSWVQRQRDAYKKTMNGQNAPISMEQIKRLLDVGFKFDNCRKNNPNRLKENWHRTTKKRPREKNDDHEETNEDDRLEDNRQDEQVQNHDVDYSDGTNIYAERLHQTHGFTNVATISAPPAGSREQGYSPFASRPRPQF
eukprot:scaffold53451_cov41-Attheya_sp.AAC.1